MHRTHDTLCRFFVILQLQKTSSSTLTTLEIIWEHTTAELLPQDLSSLSGKCISSTFSYTSGNNYRQVQGAAMGSPVSLPLAKISMTVFKVEAISSRPMKPKCWYRYVDNIFTIWPHEQAALKNLRPELQAPYHIFHGTGKGLTATLPGCSGQPTPRQLTGVCL
jgi:hypothetical protein